MDNFNIFEVFIICVIVLFVGIVMGTETGKNLVESNTNELKEWDCRLSFDINMEANIYDKNFLVDSFDIVFPCNDVDSNVFLNQISRGINYE